MKFRYLILFLSLIFAPLGIAQTQLEKGPEPTIEPTTPAQTSPAPAPAPTPVTIPAPVPSAPPETQSPIGLLILAIIMAHVSLPLTLIALLILLIAIVRIFKTGITKFVMGIATAGGVKALKGILVGLGCIVVLPAGFLGLNFAGKILDHRVTGATWWIYGIAVSVVTGMVFFTLMKAVGRVLKKQLAGKMGGLGGMMGGMGGFGGGFPGLDGGKKPRGGKPRRR